MDEESEALDIGGLLRRRISRAELYAVAADKDIAVVFGTYIKQTGVLFTSFQNIWHWKMLWG